MRLGQAAVADLLAPIKLRLQGDIGRLHAARQLLTRGAPSRVRTPEQQQQLQTLLATQDQLEQSMGPFVAAVQAGDYSVTTVTDSAIFLGQLELHLHAVDGFARALGLPPTAAGGAVGLNWPAIALWGGGGLAFLGLVTRRPLPIIAGAGLGVWGFSRLSAP